MTRAITPAVSSWGPRMGFSLDSEALYERHSECSSSPHLTKRSLDGTEAPRVTGSHGSSLFSAP